MQKLKRFLNVILLFISIIAINFFTANLLQAQQWTSSADGLLQFAKLPLLNYPTQIRYLPVLLKLK